MRHFINGRDFAKPSGFLVGYFEVFFFCLKNYSARNKLKTQLACYFIFCKVQFFRGEGNYKILHHSIANGLDTHASVCTSPKSFLGIRRN